jgi:cation transport ATPase
MHNTVIVFAAGYDTCLYSSHHTPMTTNTYPLSGLHCTACVGRVTQALQPLADKVNVTLNPMQVTLINPRADFAQLQAAVTQSGAYNLLPNQTVAQQNEAQAATETIANASTKSWLATYYPLLLIMAFILVGSLLVQVGQHAAAMGEPMGLLMHLGMGLSAVTAGETMRYFMAGFFIVFAFFKLLDLRAFADAYAGYDLLAARWHGWGLVYPFVELALGMAYLAHYNPVFTSWATIVVMGFSAIGVIRAVTNKTKIQCACLGTVFQLPMSTVTIVEDVGMVLMAALMLTQM